MYALQKDVPIPRIMRAPTTVRRKYPFEDMKVGDMFFAEGKTKNTLGTHATTVAKQLGHKYATRLTFMKKVKGQWVPCDPTDKNAVQGVGVWRTE